MTKIYIVGNPNSGKTTLFNSITKSNERVGNWHGVTVNQKSKILKFGTCQYEVVDLPGIYSLNAYSCEEQVSVDAVGASDCDKILYLLDANNFKRGMLLAINLLILGKNIKILINNYKSFQSGGGEINTLYLQKVLGCQVEIINAQKLKVDEQFFKFSTHKTSFITMLSNQIKPTLNILSNTNLNNNHTHSKQNLIDDKLDINKSNCEYDKNHIDSFRNIELLYKYIAKIDKNCVKREDNIYGFSKFDKKFLKLSIYLPFFILMIVGVVYFIFFFAGPIISEWFLKFLEITIQNTVMAILNSATNSKFLLALFEDGIFGACFSVLGFLPQICLMYLCLSVLENSGMITRVAFLLDDLLNKVGLNGKMVYTLLMGFGCSTTATISSQNMADKNSQIKASILTPFISCSAKLPIYTILGGAIFGVKNIWFILGLYLLGVVMAIVLAIVFERTILPSKDSGLLIEFPPLKKPQFKTIFQSIKNSCKQFIVKVFGVIFGAGLLIWLLSNINIKFQYVQDIGQSLLYSFSYIISWIFKPIGLNNPAIICSLLVGIIAKELILSTFAISNKVGSLDALSVSLLCSSSVIWFNVANGVSFLVFTLLYMPCISNFAVLVKTIGSKYTLTGVVIQLSLAYLTAYIIYTFLSRGIKYGLLVVLMIFIVLLCIKIIYKKVKTKKIFCNCLTCNMCDKIKK